MMSSSPRPLSALSVNCDITNKRSLTNTSPEELMVTPSSKIQKMDSFVTCPCPPTPRGKRCLSKAFFDNNGPQGLSLAELFLPSLPLTDTTNNQRVSSSSSEEVASFTSKTTKFQLQPRFSSASAEIFLPNFGRVQENLRRAAAEAQPEDDDDAEQMPPPPPPATLVGGKKMHPASFRAKLPELSTEEASSPSGSHSYARCA